MMWKLSDWPDSRIEEYGDRLTAIVSGVEWNWDPAYTMPRFRAFTAGLQLVVYIDGRWVLDERGEMVASGTGTTFEGGARALLVAFNKRRGGHKRRGGQ